MLNAGKMSEIMELQKLSGMEKFSKRTVAEELERQKLIELVTAALCNQSAEEVADHLIANGVVISKMETPTMQKWIPVTERLPDKDGSYLVLNKRKYIFDAKYESIYKSFGDWHEFVDGAGDEWITFGEITHWMPLPEPPKGE